MHWEEKASPLVEIWQGRANFCADRLREETFDSCRYSLA